MFAILIVFLGCTTDKEQNFQYTWPAEDSPSLEESSPSTAEETGIDSSTDDSGSVENTEGDTNQDDLGICSGRSIGTMVGDCAQNFRLRDRNEEWISLHDFAGQVIFLDLSSFT